MLIPVSTRWKEVDFVTEISAVEMTFKLPGGIEFRVETKIKGPASVYFSEDAPGMLVIEHGKAKATPNSRI